MMHPSDYAYELVPVAAPTVPARNNRSSRIMDSGKVSVHVGGSIKLSFTTGARHLAYFVSSGRNGVSIGVVRGERSVHGWTAT